MSSNCKQCGAALTERDAFCTKCGTTVNTARGASAANSGATTGIAAQTEAPSASAAKSSGGTPRIALIGAGVMVLLLIVAVVAGMISTAHRAREKAQKTNGASPADIGRRLNQIAAANSGTAGSNGSLAPEDVSKRLAANDRAIVATAKSQSPVEDLRRKLNDLVKDAPDDKTRAAVQDLERKLEQLASTAARNPNHPTAAGELNKGLGDITAEVTRLTPAISAATDAALTPPPVPSGPPMVPAAGTGNPKHDWPLEYERTVGGLEADLVVRTGDINNLGFGWPSDFDPFSGKSTPPHPWPDINEIPPQAPPGTDRIMLGTGVTPVHMSIQHTEGKLDRVMIDSGIKTTRGDGYSVAMRVCYLIRDSIPDNSFLGNQTKNHIQLPSNYNDFFLWVPTQRAVDCTRQRQLTMPTPIVLDVGELPSKINSVVVQIFADDFQAPVYHSYFQVSLNGTRIPTFEYVINSLNQTGPIGKLVTMRLLPEYWPLLKSGTASLLIDDPTTHVQDGYAVDFVRILVNPRKFKYQVSLTATVTDADTHKPIPGATVDAGLISSATDRQGKCQLKGIPAGLVVATASAPGYDENSVPVDLPSGQNGKAEIQLHGHQENTAALEQSIAQTGTATIYGIHFDTDSSKIRGDSIPALNAVLGLMNNHPGSHWLIAGHTDNQGNTDHNQTLSEARANSVSAWLRAHGISESSLVPQGFGATRPVADNETANGRALNRRVEVALESGPQT